MPECAPGHGRPGQARGARPGRGEQAGMAVAGPPGQGHRQRPQVQAHPPVAAAAERYRPRAEPGSGEVQPEQVRVGRVVRVQPAPPAQLRHGV